MNKEVRADIGIVGAGVTGLMLTKKFTDLGQSVALVEKQPKIAAGPSTKNEGWLHRGTYHATSIKNEQQAMEIAKRCLYGHEEIRRFAPEAIEDIGVPTYAVVGNDELAHSSVERWDKAGVAYKSVSLKDFTSLNPEVGTDKIKHVFEVGDVSINQRILYQKLLTQSEKNGAKIFLNSEFIPEDSGVGKMVRPDNEKTDIYSNMFIVTAGYGLRDVFEEVTGKELPVRYWKSHLLVFPRLTRSSTFYIDPGEAALFNHNNVSIVGQHEDAVIENEPNFETIPARERLVFDATKRLVPSAEKHDGVYMAVACIKPDIARFADQARSLDVDILRPNENYLFALPGKMTEAPYVADKIVQMVFDGNKTTNTEIALRPCDFYNIGGI